MVYEEYKDIMDSIRQSNIAKLDSTRQAWKDKGFQDARLPLYGTNLPSHLVEEDNIANSLILDIINQISMAKKVQGIRFE